MGRAGWPYHSAPTYGLEKIAGKAQAILTKAQDLPLVVRDANHSI
jgi:hypothetical protein